MRKLLGTLAVHSVTESLNLLQCTIVIAAYFEN